MPRSTREAAAVLEPGPKPSKGNTHGARLMLSEALTRGLLFALLGLQKTSFLVELAELGQHENWKPVDLYDLYTVWICSDVSYLS